jgi:hypothetical protein
MMSSMSVKCVSDGITQYLTYRHRLAHLELVLERDLLIELDPKLELVLEHNQGPGLWVRAPRQLRKAYPLSVGLSSLLASWRA